MLGGNDAENGYRRVFLLSRRDTSTGENEISEESRGRMDTTELTYNTANVSRLLK